MIEEIEAKRTGDQGIYGGLHRARAGGLYRAAINLQAPLVREFPEAMSYLLWQANFQDALGRVLREQHDANESILVLEVVIMALNVQLKKESGSIEVHRWLAALNRNISRSYRQIGDDFYEGLAEHAATCHDDYVRDHEK